MTFSESEQKLHRDLFIEECRQKAWGAACNADWIGKQMDDLMAQYTKMQEEDRGLEAEITGLQNALDSHTKENRLNRNGLQERRTKLASTMRVLGKNATEAEKAMQNLYASVETNLELAKHAEGWAWKEVATAATSEDTEAEARGGAQ